MNTICTIPWDVMEHWKRALGRNLDKLDMDGFKRFMKEAQATKFFTHPKSPQHSEGWAAFEAWFKPVRLPQWYLDMSEEAHRYYEATKNNGAGI